MRYHSVLILALLAADVMSQIPNVFEFCSALMGDTRSPGSCDRACPQGRPGKRGSEGRRGPIGPKGDRGVEGTCDTLKTKVEKLEKALIYTQRIALLPDNYVNACGLGMKSGEIPNSAISESNKWDGNYAGYYGRLDRSGTQVWVVRNNAIGHWIQVDLTKATGISGVVTQGRPTSDQWVTSFKLGCGNNTSTWEIVSENDAEKVFPGNSDRNTKVVNFLPSVMICRYVRLYVQSWRSHTSMRMELLGGDCATLLHL